MGKLHSSCSLCMIFQQSQGKVHQSGLWMSRILLLYTDAETVMFRIKNASFYIMQKISMYCWHFWSATVFQTSNSVDEVQIKMETAPSPSFHFYSCISLKLQSTASSICTREEIGILDWVNARSRFLLYSVKENKSVYLLTKHFQNNT